MGTGADGLFISYKDIWLLDGVRTAFAVGGGQGIALLLETPVEKATC